MKYLVALNNSFRKFWSEEKIWLSRIAVTLKILSRWKILSSFTKLEGEIDAFMGKSKSISKEEQRTFYIKDAKDSWVVVSKESITRVNNALQDIKNGTKRRMKRMLVIKGIAAWNLDHLYLLEEETRVQKCQRKGFRKIKLGDMISLTLTKETALNRASKRINSM